MIRVEASAVMFCWIGCWRTGLTVAGLGGADGALCALEVVDRRVWRRARVWAGVRVGGVVLVLVSGTAMWRGCR